MKTNLKITPEYYITFYDDMDASYNICLDYHNTIKKDDLGHYQTISDLIQNIKDSDDNEQINHIKQLREYIKDGKLSIYKIHIHTHSDSIITGEDNQTAGILEMGAEELTNWWDDIEDSIFIDTADQWYIEYKQYFNNDVIDVCLHMEELKKCNCCNHYHTHKSHGMIITITTYDPDNQNIKLIQDVCDGEGYQVSTEAIRNALDNIAY